MLSTYNSCCETGQFIMLEYNFFLHFLVFVIMHKTLFAEGTVKFPILK